MSSIDIPNGVTSIGPSTFLGCASLSSFKVPDSVIEIGHGAFEGCTKLLSIDIPDGVTSIGASAFQGCTSLTSIKMSDSVVEIGHSAFSGCTGLTFIKIPSKVTRIEEYAFDCCSGLKSIEIPDCVKEIGEGAFRCCTGLTDVKIPSKVTKIEECAFVCCSGLMSIEIPNLVAEIGEWAFYRTGLEIIRVSPDNQYYSSESNCCLTKDGKTLLFGCNSSTIPIGVAEIKRYAFSGCSGLTSVVIPDTVISIEESAFEDTNLEEIQVSSDNQHYCCVNNCCLTRDGVKLIFGCNSSIIPNGVTEIGERAFSGCTRLTSVKIPSSVTKIGDWAFFGCTGLKSVGIPGGVIEIGYGAFYNIGLEEIKVSPDNHYYCSVNNCCLTKDGRALIFGCNSSTIPDGVVEIEDYAFSGCSDLKSIELPNSVKEIGPSAFAGCSGLKSIDMSDNVIYIDSEAFKNCSNLESVVLAISKNNPVDSENFISKVLNSINSQVKVTVKIPIGSEKAYENYEGLDQNRLLFVP